MPEEPQRESPEPERAPEGDDRPGEDTVRSDSGAVDPGAVDSGAVDPGAGDSGAVDPVAVDSGAVDPGAVDSVAGATAWSRLRRMGRPRLTRANLIVGLLALTLGFAIAAQVRQTDLEGLANLRSDELVRILDNVTQENSRLSGEIRELERTRGQLAAGASSEEARTAAQSRLDAIQVLSGTVAATGPGIEMRISDPEGRIDAAYLLDALQELRDAGAEAVEISDVRVVASTYFTDLDGGVAVSGQRLEPPYVILAIGDPATMAAAMDIPGGVRERARRLNADADVVQRDSLDINSLHTPRTPEYSQPIPSPTSE